MSKIDIKKTELVWRGKYDDEGKLVPIEKPGPYPFQIVECINEPRIEKGDDTVKQTTLFDTWKGDEGSTFEDGWKNKLIWGDNKFVMSSLLEKFAGKIDLIYIDPPFTTGADFTLDVTVGDKGESIHKEHSLIEEKAYRDTWGKGTDSFLLMMHERLILMRDLLSDKGSIYIHLDYRTSSLVKLIMDEILGSDNFQNDIIWFYKTGGATKERWSRKHDTLLYYTKSPGNGTFNVQYEKSFMMHHYGFKKSDFKIDEETGLQYSMVISRDVWDLPSVGSATSERVDYPTQKPEILLERIIKASSNEGDLVADFFCGSGTTIAVAEKLNRRWISVDLGRFAVHTTRKRLLEIEHSKSLATEEKKYGKKARAFEILNLGRYERQFWKIKAFGIKMNNKHCMNTLHSF